MVTIVLDPEFGLRKEEVISHLNRCEIDSRPFFHPLSSIPAYRDQEQALAAQKRNRVSYRISPYGVNLPSGLNLSDDQITYVSDCVKNLIRAQ